MLKKIKIDQSFKTLFLIKVILKKLKKEKKNKKKEKLLN
jgi:hypothetical protein